MSYTRIKTIVTRAYPLLGNMVACGSLYSLGDLSQQTLFKPKDQNYNFDGTKRIAGITFFAFGPIFHFWYKMLDRRLPGTAMRAVIPKLLLDQFVCAPICLGIFFLGLSILEKQDDIFKELREKGLKVYITGSVFWPTAQAFNFTLCPPHLRTVYVSACAFLWSNILCYIKGDRQVTQDDAGADITSDN